MGQSQEGAEGAVTAPATAAAAAACQPSQPAAAGPSTLVPAMGPFQKGRAAQRAALARSLGEDTFAQLLARVESAYAAACGGRPPALCVQRPAECEEMLAAPSHLRPFDLKHGVQQASIVGNMQRVGLIAPGPQGAAGVAVVELGAGKGYLGGTLATCCGVRRLVATDIKAGLKLKADRHLRHIVFARHRVDLKDYVPAATPELLQAGGAAAVTAAAGGSDTRGDCSAAAPASVPWVAVAKHLCGAATDYGLRACLLPPHAKLSAAASGGAKAGQEAAAVVATAVAAAAAPAAGCRAGGGAAGGDGGDSGGGGGRRDGDGDSDAGQGSGPRSGCRSEATGAGKRPRREGGADVAAVSSTGEHGDGAADADAAAGGGGGGGSGGAAAGGGVPGCAELRGLAIAPCCHHRCGWRAYVGKPLFRRLGFSPHDFELISWMTGWALCGHDSPAGVAAPGGAGPRSEGGSEDDDGDGDGRLACGGCDSCDGCEDGARSEDGGPSLCDPAWGEDGGLGCGPATQLASSVAPGPSQQQQQALPQGGADGLNAAAISPSLPSSVAAAPPPPPSAEQPPQRAVRFEPAATLPRLRRMEIGQMCKQLIDAGRLEWLRSRFRSADLVSYVGPEVTGENRLLLAVGPVAGGGLRS